MSYPDTLTSSLSQNKEIFQSIFPIGSSFDFITRDLSLGSTPCFFLGLNGLCDLEIMLLLFSDIQAPDFQAKAEQNGAALPQYVKDQFLYAQISFSSSIQELTKSVLCGPCILLIDGYDQALIIDTRKYPTRSTEEPDTEKVIQGAKDGFVESLLTNCNLIRRRLRSPNLTFAIHSVGTLSQTDVAVSYVKGHCDERLLQKIEATLDSLDTSALTMGIQSLKELLNKKSMFHPMPDSYLTQRPDVACSYLAEGYILLLVDNSPFALVLPCNIFQFTQNPEDYYKSPLIGSYLRTVRFGCLIFSMFLMPLLLLFGQNPNWLPEIFQKLIPSDTTPLQLFIYILFVELGLDIFKYASAHSSSGFSGSFAIVGGLLIGDMAVNLEWANNEVIFYGAATLLASMGITSVELSDAIKIYRLFLILCTGFFPTWGFFAGLVLIFVSLITTPVFGNKSYFWPLFPFHWASLKTLLFRYPTFKAQPENRKYLK